MKVMNLEGERLVYWLRRANEKMGNDKIKGDIDVQPWPPGGFTAAWAEDPDDLSKNWVLTWGPTFGTALGRAVVEIVFGAEVQDQ